jgi:hypothetical protein
VQRRRAACGLTWRRLRAGLVSALLLWHGAALAQPNALEYAVKATYIYKFGPFVEWPDSSFAGPAGFEICIVGADPFGMLLDDAVRGEQIRGRPIAIRRLAEIRPGSGCHVVFAGGSPTQSVRDILKAVAGEPVLTVTDSALSREEKGIVHFVVHDDRVRFEIDDRAAADNGLLISSKVLSLALAVRPRL